MIDSEGNEFPPCAWCGMDAMNEYADDQAKDICVDCADEARMLEEE